jgi:hypothetical protein
MVLGLVCLSFFYVAQQKGVAVQREIVLTINYGHIWARHPLVFFVRSNPKLAGAVFSVEVFISPSQLGRCGSRQHLRGAALSYRRPGSLVQQLASGTPTYGHLAHSKHMLHEATKISQGVPCDIVETKRKINLFNYTSQIRSILVSKSSVGSDCDPFLRTVPEFRWRLKKVLKNTVSTIENPQDI